MEDFIEFFTADPLNAIDLDFRRSIFRFSQEETDLVIDLDSLESSLYYIGREGDVNWLLGGAIEDVLVESIDNPGVYTRIRLTFVTGNGPVVITWEGDYGAELPYYTEKR